MKDLNSAALKYNSYSPKAFPAVFNYDNAVFRQKKTVIFLITLSAEQQ